MDLMDLSQPARISSPFCREAHGYQWFLPQKSWLGPKGPSVPSPDA
jgi:hypothetical protein